MSEFRASNPKLVGHWGTVTNYYWKNLTSLLYGWRFGELPFMVITICSLMYLTKCSNLCHVRGDSWSKVKWILVLENRGNLFFLEQLWSVIPKNGGMTPQVVLPHWTGLNLNKSTLVIRVKYGLYVRWRIWSTNRCCFPLSYMCPKLIRLLSMGDNVIYFVVGFKSYNITRIESRRETWYDWVKSGCKTMTRTSFIQKTIELLYFTEFLFSFYYQEFC